MSTNQRSPLWTRALLAVLVAQFLSALADNALLFAALALGVFINWVININIFSLHGMYRMRLMRAFLGASNVFRKPNPFTNFDPKDTPFETDLRRTIPKLNTMLPDGVSVRLDYIADMLTVLPASQFCYNPDCFRALATAVVCRRRVDMVSWTASRKQPTRLRPLRAGPDRRRLVCGRLPPQSARDSDVRRTAGQGCAADR